MKFLINIGGGCFVARNQIKYILAVDSKPIKRIYSEWQKSPNFIDITHGKKMKAVVITTDFIYSTNVTKETIAKRCGEATEDFSAEE